MRVSSPVIESVEVARYLMTGARAVQQCRYTYQGKLYSIRWYKNGKEFYRCHSPILLRDRTVQ